MKKNIFKVLMYGAILTPLVLTSCSSDDDTIETPVNPGIENRWIMENGQSV